jgi:DNA-binding IclR family transcriptional regulator
MGIGNNKVHSLMQDLLEEGFLDKDGRSYIINVDQDELSKWKNIGDL